MVTGTPANTDRATCTCAATTTSQSPSRNEAWYPFRVYDCSQAIRTWSHTRQAILESTVSLLSRVQQRPLPLQPSVASRG